MLNGSRFSQEKNGQTPDHRNLLISTIGTGILCPCAKTISAKAGSGHILNDSICVTWNRGWASTTYHCVTFKLYSYSLRGQFIIVICRVQLGINYRSLLGKLGDTRFSLLQKAKGGNQSKASKIDSSFLTSMPDRIIAARMKFWLQPS